MELDDLKKAWHSQQSNIQQQNLTSKFINEMIQKKYNSKINKITYPEIIGSLICLMAVIFIGLNFYKLDTVFLKGVGVIAILVLLAMVALSFLSLKQLRIKRDFNKPYAEVLKIFASQKINFYRLQKTNMMLSYLLLVTVIILVAKFFNGKDITESKYFWIFSFSLGYIFLIFVAKFVAKFYKNTLTKSEKLLQELQSEKTT